MNNIHVKQESTSLLFVVFIMMVTSIMRAQQTPLIPNGYYTLGPLSHASSGYLYSYDTDALRSPYGNVADYAHPLGKNGEHAYLYNVNGAGVNQANKTYYFSSNVDGSYTIQSCSGEAYSYLDVARYDRHLVIHSLKPRHCFHLRAYADTSPWPEGEYVMQQVQNAALFDSLATVAHGLDALQVLTPLDSDKVTPALTIRRAMSDARGVMALYPCGENPGQVSPLLSSSLREDIEVAQILSDDRNTTLNQAEEVIQRLQNSAQAYEETAATAINPVTEGYYWLTSAYRAFELRQNKQKVIREEEVDGQMILRWNDASVNDGSTVFLITSSGENMVMQDYMGRWVGKPSGQERTLPVLPDYTGTSQIFKYDTEGMFTIADEDSPSEFFSAANSFVGEKGLYGKPNDGVIKASGGDYLYPGYCSSWFLQRAYHQISVPSSGWTVLSVSFPSEVPEGVEVYSVVDKEGSLILVPYTQQVIPARTAVVLHAVKGNYTFWSTFKQVAAIEGNVLVANCVDSKNMVSGSMALLKVKNGEVGFQKSSLKQISAGSAYIPYLEGQEEFRVLQEDEDGIVNEESLSQRSEVGSKSSSAIYDLSGHKIFNASSERGENQTGMSSSECEQARTKFSVLKKGVYIHNNKKVLKR